MDKLPEESRTFALGKLYTWTQRLVTTRYAHRAIYTKMSPLIIEYFRQSSLYTSSICDQAVDTDWRQPGK